MAVSSSSTRLRAGTRNRSGHTSGQTTCPATRSTSKAFAASAARHAPARLLRESHRGRADGGGRAAPRRKSAGCIAPSSSPVRPPVDGRSQVMRLEVVTATTLRCVRSKPHAALLAQIQVIAPGLALAVAVGLTARLIAQHLPVPISEVPMAVLLGIIVGSLFRLPKTTASGIKFAGQRVLRLGIILLGARLSLGDVLGIGIGTL